MKILKKRSIAILIDSFILGSIFVFCQKISNILGLRLEKFDLLLVIPFFLKDIVFRNASIGKKVVGIAIYDDNWQPPKFTVLIKRTVLMLTIGYLLFWKIKFIEGNIIRIFDWEQNFLKTSVIDKKVYKKLDEDAKKMDGQYSKNMTELYNIYLRDLYAK